VTSGTQAPHQQRGGVLVQGGCLRHTAGVLERPVRLAAPDQSECRLLPDVQREPVHVAPLFVEPDCEFGARLCAYAGEQLFVEPGQLCGVVGATPQYQQVDRHVDGDRCPHRVAVHLDAEVAQLG
jgi:hypothetical protein